MRKKPKPADAPTSNESVVETNSETHTSVARQQFLVAAANMSWQLAVVVLVPIIGGVTLDKTFGTAVYTFIGLAVALIGSGLVMWRAMQAANRLPVPKLTAAQKRAIQQSYEEEDDD